MVVYVGGSLAYVSSKKQKCMTKSPTEAELVGLTDNVGLVELFENAGILVQQGNRLRWIHPETNEETLLYRKEWKDDKLDMIMGNYQLMPSNKGLEEIEENVE